MDEQGQKRWKEYQEIKKELDSIITEDPKRIIARAVKFILEEIYLAR